MKNYRWSVGAAALCVLALSAYGCASDPAIDEEDGTSSSGGKSGSSGNKSDGGKSSSSGGKSSSSGSSGRSSSSGGGNTSSGGGSSSGDVDTDGGASSSSSSSSSSGSVPDGGNTDNCTVITAAAWAGDAVDVGYFSSTFAPAPAGTERTQLSLEFYNAEVESVVPAVATYQLDSAVNSSYQTCEQCILAQAGTQEAPTVAFFQKSGSVKVTAAAPRSVTATLTDVILVEVDPGDHEPVAGGGCLKIDGTVNVAAP